MQEFQLIPDTGEELVYMVTRRNLHLRNMFYIGDMDSPCFRTRAEAREFDVPWADLERDHVFVIAVATESGCRFSSGEIDERVVGRVPWFNPGNRPRTRAALAVEESCIRECD